MSTLVKWAPFSEIDVFERRMRRMLEDFGVAPAPLRAADTYGTEKESSSSPALSRDAGTRGSGFRRAGDPRVSR